MKNAEKLNELLEKYTRIKNQLDKLYEQGKLSAYDKNAIISMTKKIVRNLASKHEKIRRGVGKVMGGQVVIHEAEVLTQKGKMLGAVEMVKKVCCHFQMLQNI